MTEPFDLIRDMIADNDVDGAIERLREILLGRSRQPGHAGRRFRDLANDITVEAGAWRGLARDRRRGLLEPAEMERRERRARIALLGLIDDAADLSQRVGGPTAPETPAVSLSPPETSSLEKVWGRNTLQNVAWLAKGIEAARAVCRVVTPRTLGTGFLIGGGRVVTNNHVVADAAEAAGAVVEFNFEEDPLGRLQPVVAYPASGDGFATSVDLDCSVLRVTQIDDAPPLSNWGALRLDGRGALEVGQHVSIIQHPNGGQKKIAVTANEIVNLFDHRVQYLTDTMPGSSGAPVFDDGWTVVALHRAGGNLLKNARGERIFANEGVSMQTLLADPSVGPALSAVAGAG